MSSVQVVWLLNSRVHLTPGVYGRVGNAQPDSPVASGLVITLAVQQGPD